MTTATTNAIAAKRWLRHALRARADLGGASVCSAHYGDKTPQRAIVLGDVDVTRDEWAAPSNRYREQSYAIDGAIWIVTPGDDEHAIDDAADRALALLAIVEDVVRVAHKLGGTVASAQVELRAIEEGANPNGRWCQVTFAVVVDDRLVST